MTKVEENAQEIIDILKSAGFTALFAGGYVRDKILKRKVNDIDIATSAKPDEIKKVLEKANIKHIEIGEQFGVIAAVIPKGPLRGSGQKSPSQIFEIATFREDHGIGDNRHPDSVKMGVGPYEDVLRRDFTINGLLAVAKIKDQKLKIKNDEVALSRDANSHLADDSQFQIHKLPWGTVFDAVGGIKDIKSGVVKFIGDPGKRIEEDALRMMRAVRFAVQLGFKIEEKSYQSIKENSELIRKISSERIRDELNKIIISPDPSHGFDLLERLGLLRIIVPELEKAKSTDQPKNMHAEGNVWNHMLLCLKNMRKHDDPIYAWGVLLHDVAKSYTVQTPEKDGTDRIRFTGHDSEGAKMTEKIMRRLKFSNEEVDKASWLVKYHMLFSNFMKMREARRIKYMAHPYFSDLLELFWVDANSSLRTGRKGNILPPDLTMHDRVRKILEEERGKKPLPKKIITGHDVMSIMGIKEGSREVGKILDQVYDAQLEKKFTTKKEGLQLVKKLLKKK